MKIPWLLVGLAASALFCRFLLEFFTFAP